ncbi:poly(3-hydroxyalkanoate) granule-associated protein PhaI [Pseudomonas daroniae]|uniref:Poly(3-hydroxyalkanoate) granule-associated protein PhaI n=1 Tax=Phytopseudomonas daroniae TaxID=2487519 RepID=A0A4Q9QTB5_9GAMM|nr:MULTISPECIES: phasin family protein [Pseudomonas]TBU76877.1 poly(3-hydroxyalkanoate) granule-associated protein PhaI [Pseudomonas sp. FRB 228]TBU84056.1 poly(3-hydroxyalkanoate) granule-associated protein PhaI [Pseudomonas daroniae]TBU93234.1 poly(3-hydroxyalkanoate) granule-associated protein PhaI [Pseudomonas daroniae]
MSNATVRKKTLADTTLVVVSDAPSYARKVWLAGLGVYAKAGQEGLDYLRELIRLGAEAEQRGKKQVNEQVEAANGQIDGVKSRVSVVKNKVAARIEKIEQAFDSRVAGALNRLGVPARQDIEALSAKLDELSALLEHVARTK